MTLRFNFNNRGDSTKKLDVYQRMIVSQEFRLAGIQFHQGLRLYNDLAVGETLTIRPEPDNEHDKSAIAIFRGEDQIGYVERDAAPDVARLLKNYGDGSTVLVIAALDDRADLYNKVRLVAYTVFYTLS